MLVPGRITRRDCGSILKWMLVFQFRCSLFSIQMCFLKGRTSDRHQPSHQVHSPQPLPQSPLPSPPLPSPPLPSQSLPDPSPHPSQSHPFFPISLPSAIATTPSSGLSLSLCLCQVLEFSDRGLSLSLCLCQVLEFSDRGLSLSLCLCQVLEFSDSGLSLSLCLCQVLEFSDRGLSLSLSLSGSGVL